MSALWPPFVRSLDPEPDPRLPLVVIWQNDEGRLTECMTWEVSGSRFSSIIILDHFPGRQKLW